jgi:aryl-alcohol dehydrogenase-like predicted oxidoreductase
MMRLEGGVMMKYLTFGRSGLRVSEAFLGTMTFGTEWGWGASPEECRKLFTAYAEAGGNVIDTASGYTEGASEAIVGDLLGTDRDRFVVATKYTVTCDGDDPNASGNHRKSLQRSLEQSLRRLRTDRVDLLYVGISDTPAWVVAKANTLADWRGWSPFIGLQVPYSLVQREIERELLPMAADSNLSVAAWSPLAGGVLTGKFTRGSQEGPARVNRDEISGRDLRIAAEVDAVADGLGVTSSQVALAWVRSRRPFVHLVLGARHADQLAGNLAALDLELPGEAVRRLDEVSAIPLGFPHDFIESTRSYVYGPAGEKTGRAG